MRTLGQAKLPTQHLAGLVDYAELLRYDSHPRVPWRLKTLHGAK
jgi:hypothetical protein